MNPGSRAGAAGPGRAWRRARGGLGGCFVVLLALFAQWAGAACSVYNGKVVINEYYYLNPNYIELKILDPSVVGATSSLAGWTLTVYDIKPSDQSVKTTTTQNVGTVYGSGGASNVCGASSPWVRFDFANNDMSNDTVVVLRDAAGDEVDAFRIGQSSYPTYYTPQCSYASGGDRALTSSSGPKDISRTPDGSGGWSVMPGTGNNSLTTSCTSNDNSNYLTVSKTASASTIGLGQNVTFTVTVAASANIDAGNVNVTDALPAGFSLVSAASSRGSYASPTWSVGALPKNSPATLTLVAKAIANGTYTNVATAADANFPTLTASGSATVIVATPANFDAVATGAAPATPIFTKLAGTAFTLDILVLDAAGGIVAGFAGSPTVELVDGAAAACATASPLAGVTVVPAPYAYTGAGAGKDNGRHSYTFTAANAARNVRVRISDPTVAAGAAQCSSDSFAIRPASFALSQSGLAGSPLVAGTDFTLTAAAGVAGYDGTPALVLAGRTLAADVSGGATAALAGGMLTLADAANSVISDLANNVFPAAGGAPATTALALRYHDVGYLELAAGAVADKSFTAIDGTSDCVAGSGSNTESGGKFGCEVWSLTPVEFGRFRPDHFDVVFTTTPGCVAGGFTYMDHDAFAMIMAIKALSSRSLQPTRYTAGYPVLATLDLKAVTGAGAGSDRSSRVTQPALSAPPWNAGAATLSDTYRFDARNASPVVVDGAYDDFRLRLKATDTDGVLITTLTRNGTSSIVTPAADSVDSASSSLRFGRLWFDNAFGSEKMDLSIAYEAQYWNGFAFVRNTLDTASCTSLSTANVALGNYQGALTAANTGLSHVTFGAFAGGGGSIAVSKPSPAASGSVDLVANLGATTLYKCTAWMPEPTATASSLSHLRGKWCGSADDRDPVARFTFGIYGNSVRRGVLYLRENY